MAGPGTLQPGPLNGAHLPQHLIEGLFPTREVHLTGGPSGSGKTTLLMQMLRDWRQGIPVFGMKSNPVPFAYLACDRSIQSIVATLERIKIPLDFPLFSLVDKCDATIENLMGDGYKLIIADGLPSLTPHGKISDYGIVADFLRNLTRTCQRFDSTIIGTGHASKVKEGEQFQNPRQRFLGSVAWGGYSDTMILVEPKNPEDVLDPYRTVLLLPRNASGQILNYCFDENGILVNQAPIEVINFTAMVLKNPPGTQIFITQMLEYAHKVKMNERTMYRYVKTMTTEGRLAKVAHGVYKVVHPS